MLKDKKETIYQKLELGGVKQQLEVDFIATTLDDKEVYDIRLDGDHYGYMTQELLRSLKKVDPLEGDNNLDKLYFNLKEDTFKMNQRVILDAPKELRASYRKISLCRKEYSDELSKTITIRPAEEFYLESSDSFLEFNFPNDTLEANSFCIFNKNSINGVKDRSATYNLSFDKGIAGTVIIERMNDIKEICFNAELGRQANLTIGNFTNNIPDIVVKAKENISLIDTTIDYLPYDDKDYSKNVIFDCGDYLQAHNSKVSFVRTNKKSDKPFGVETSKGILIQQCNLNFLDFNKIEGLSTSDPLGYLQRNDEITVIFKESQIKSYIDYEPYNMRLGGGSNGLENYLTINDSMLDNKNNKFRFKGNIYLNESTINNDGQKVLELFSVSANKSSFTNISSIFHGDFCLAEVENFSLSNKNYGSNRNHREKFSGSFSVGHSYNDSEEKAVVLKNCSVNLGTDDFFTIDGYGTFTAENSSFNGSFTAHDYTADNTLGLNCYYNNCIFNKVKIISSGMPDHNSLSSNNSEFKGSVNLDNIESIENSIIENSSLKASTSGKIENSYINSYSGSTKDFTNGLLSNFNSSMIGENENKIDSTVTREIEAL